MKPSGIFTFFLLLFCGAFFLSAGIPINKPEKFPYEKAGLTERQAAAHLLNRFAYGATPGQIDEVVKMGLENWFAKQLTGKLADEELDQRLKSFDAINLSNAEVSHIFPRNAEFIKMAVQDGKIPKDSIAKAGKQEYKDLLANYMKDKGLRPRQELFRQFINQKILRATYSNNQLQEVLTDFWFNHFNVSITKLQCAEFIPAYERDVIRPNVFGKFGKLLLATAKSPAMLYYLDNFSSAGVNTSPLTLQNAEKMKSRINSTKPAAKVENTRKNQGLNENYAREVMELHTMGVDGGYTQQDVTQAARVLTGWTVFPLGTYVNNDIKKLINKVGQEAMDKSGFFHDGDFLFAAARHDNGEKTVLGHKFAAGGGYEEGVTLLDILAHHPSTAKFISRKLAIRFISDHPDEALVSRLAKVFKDKDGDLKEMMTAIAYAPEFWNAKNIREKTKSPFELVISTMRAIHADVVQPYQLYTWMTRMGQQIYYYQAPTGFPDYGQYWINTGSLLNRMNFGLSVAAQKIPGVKVDLLALNNNHEPESAEAALTNYCKLIMPERDLEATIKRLTPLLNDKDLSAKVVKAAAQKPAVRNTVMNQEDIPGPDKLVAKAPGSNNPMLAQVIGIIIGSPEFQRR